jgi:type IV pilus assembly protein PilV
MQRSLASSLAQDMIERMRSNDSTILESYEGVYGAQNLTAPGNRCNQANSLCTPAQMVTNDLYEWEQALKGANVQFSGKNAGGLIGATGCITHTVNQVVIVVTWQGRENIADGAQKNSTLAKACGSASKKRRQVVIDGFIY